MTNKSFESFYSFLVEKERETAERMLDDCCNFILSDRSCGTKFQREGLIRRLRQKFQPRTKKELVLEVLYMLEGRNDMFLDKYQIKLIRDSLKELVNNLEDK